MYQICSNLKKEAFFLLSYFLCEKSFHCFSDLRKRFGSLGEWNTLTFALPPFQKKDYSFFICKLNCWFTVFVTEDYNLNQWLPNWVPDSYSFYSYKFLRAKTWPNSISCRIFFGTEKVSFSFSISRAEAISANLTAFPDFYFWKREKDGISEIISHTLFFTKKCSLLLDGYRPIY